MSTHDLAILRQGTQIFSACMAENPKPSAVAHFRARGSAQGFTLVELLIGMALSLIGVLVIYQVLTSTQAYRRNTAGASSAQTNGAIALYYLERDLRQAGYGVQATSRNRSQTPAVLKAQLTSLYSCTVNARNATAGNFTFALAPFVITPGANANTPDSLTVLYGNSPLLSGGTPLAPNKSVTATGDVWVQSIQGFSANDVFIIANPPANCEMSQVTTPCTLANPPDTSCSNVTFSFTQTGGIYSKSLASSYGPGTDAGAVPTASVYNLGQKPVLATYSISTDTINTLQSTLNRRDQFEIDGTSNPITRNIADDIVNLKIQVGFQDGTFQTYTATQDWSKVSSLRIAVVARSNLQEKGVVTQAVDQGTLHLFPVVMSGATVVTPAVDMTLSSDQQHFRYKVYSTVVPLRNLLWNPS